MGQKPPLSEAPFLHPLFCLRSPLRELERSFCPSATSRLPTASWSCSLRPRTSILTSPRHSWGRVSENTLPSLNSFPYTPGPVPSSGPGMSYLQLLTLQIRMRRAGLTRGSEEARDRAVDTKGGIWRKLSPLPTPGWTPLTGRCREGRLSSCLSSPSLCAPHPTPVSSVFSVSVNLPPPHQLSVGTGRRCVGARVEAA